MSRKGRPEDAGRSAQREANKAFKEQDAKKAMSEHEAAQTALLKNRDRLKAERLAREVENEREKQRLK